MLTRTLLAQGYFPPELPPTFTTKDFGHHAYEIIDDWQDHGLFKKNSLRNPIYKGGPKKSGAFEYKLTEETEAEVFSKPKRGYERRDCHITHPLPQALLSREIAENWSKLYTWLDRAKYSLEDIRLSEDFDRAIKPINFGLHFEKKSFLEASCDWLVSTDITRFYPSIYTHSIPWAAYGKEKVKADKALYRGSLADRLDTLVRACNRNQTIGIPIGPETSRILAEVVSARIDHEIASSSTIVMGEATDRLQDDWKIGVESLTAAENALAEITSAYRKFGLEINGSKTSINHILMANNVNWTAEIRSYLSNKRGLLSPGELKDFLDLTLQLHSESPDQPVVKYALATLEGKRLPTSGIIHLESFLLKAAVVAPGAMDRICRIVLEVQHNTGKLSVPRITARLVELAEKKIAQEHHFEAIWLLYTLRGLNARFKSTKISELAEDMQSASIALVLLDMKERRSFRSKLPINKWEQQSTEENICRDWSWLLAYEGVRNGWLNDTKGLSSSPLLRLRTH